MVVCFVVLRSRFFSGYVIDAVVKALKSALAPAKNRKDRTSAADCGGPAAFRAATLSGSGDIPSLENSSEV